MSSPRLRVADALLAAIALAVVDQRAEGRGRGDVGPDPGVGEPAALAGPPVVGDVEQVWHQFGAEARPSRNHEL